MVNVQSFNIDNTLPARLAHTLSNSEFFIAKLNTIIPENRGLYSKIINGGDLAGEKEKLVEKGDYLFVNNDFDSSISTFEQALMIDPADIQTILWLGGVNFRNGDYATAIKYYNIVLDVAEKSDDVTFKECYEFLGKSYYEMGQYDKSLTYLTIAYKLDNHNRAVNKYLASNYVKLGMNDDAMNQYQNCINIGVCDVDFFLEMASFLNEEKCYSCAEEACLRAYELGVKEGRDGTDVNIFRQIAVMFEKAKDFKRADFYENVHMFITNLKVKTIYRKNDADKIDELKARIDKTLKYVKSAGAPMNFAVSADYQAMALLYEKYNMQKESIHCAEKSLLAYSKKVTPKLIIHRCSLCIEESNNK